VQLREQWLSKISTDSRAAVSSALFDQHFGPRALRPESGPWKIIAPMGLLTDGVDGFSVATIEDVAELRNLPLHSLILRNEGGDVTAAALVRLISTLPLDPSRLQISFGLTDVKQAQSIFEQGFTGPYFDVAGDDLGSNLITAVGLMRQLDFLNDQRLSTAVSITLSANQNMFESMAKFRAMRILWSRALSDCKWPDAPLALHGILDAALYSNTDSPHFIMRAVASVMGAGFGGASSISIKPLSTEELDVRMARNVQIILQRESHLWRVNDPAAGAGYVEQLTEALCEKAWDTFQKSEQKR
jgi:methylmalonyl-CoA mutase